MFTTVNCFQLCIIIIMLIADYNSNGTQISLNKVLIKCLFLGSWFALSSTPPTPTPASSPTLPSFELLSGQLNQGGQLRVTDNTTGQLMLRVGEWGLLLRGI